MKSGIRTNHNNTLINFLGLFGKSWGAQAFERKLNLGLSVYIIKGLVTVTSQEDFSTQTMTKYFNTVFVRL